jgi:uncharacterized protein (DUF1330 family)
MAGYWIIRGSEVKDQESFEEYARLWGPIAERYEAKFIAGGNGHETREGEGTPRILIVEFPSYEQAIACYDDPEYQATLEFAHKAYDRDFVIVNGMS